MLRLKDWKIIETKQALADSYKSHDSKLLLTSLIRRTCCLEFTLICLSNFCLLTYYDFHERLSSVYETIFIHDVYPSSNWSTSVCQTLCRDNLHIINLLSFRLPFSLKSQPWPYTQADIPKSCLTTSIMWHAPCVNTTLIYHSQAITEFCLLIVRKWPSSMKNQPTLNKVI